jgi:hypothetical protein
MNRESKIFWMGVLVSYVLYSYGAIENKMNDQAFFGKQSNCHQIEASHHTPPKGYTNTCDPIALMEWRDAGGLLWAYQHDVLTSVDQYLRRNYYRNIAIGVLCLSALPWLIVKAPGFWARLRSRKRRGY